MTKALKFIPILLLVVALGGCQSLAYSLVKGIYGDQPFTQDAAKAVAISMSAYDKGLQPQIERYGNFPAVGTAACAAQKTTLLCRDPKLWAKLQQGDAIASSAIHKARQVIDGVLQDDAGTALTDAAQAIRNTETDLLSTTATTLQVTQ